jgi:hypothetical protein
MSCEAAREVIEVMFTRFIVSLSQLPGKTTSGLYQPVELLQFLDAFGIAREMKAMTMQPLNKGI